MVSKVRAYTDLKQKLLLDAYQKSYAFLRKGSFIALWKAIKAIKDEYNSLIKQLWPWQLVLITTVTSALRHYIGTQLDFVPNLGQCYITATAASYILVNATSQFYKVEI